MLYIRLENFMPVEAVDGGQIPNKSKLNMARDTEGGVSANGWINANDIGSLAYAKTLAILLTENTSKEYLATNDGLGRGGFDVIEAPEVGDPVSKGFNGDYYPQGVITKITPTWQITTSTGAKFRRVGESGSWMMTGGTWRMVKGHHDERNPHF